MKLSIQTSLDYYFPNLTDVLLQIEAAAIPEQMIEAAHIAISETGHFARVAGHDTIGERIWLRLQGRLTVTYSATVTINRLLPDCRTLAACPTHLLPGETVQYLLPSRYCPSDLFQTFVDAQFGGLSGGARVMAIRDWIYGNFSYVPGASNVFTTALESFVTRQGVCRDLTHVLITLVRACAIPARFASVYSLGVVPQDFHAVAEVFLDGAWHLVDATGMGRAADMAKIGVGRDAADVSFLTSYGQAILNSQTVNVAAA